MTPKINDWDYIDETKNKVIVEICIDEKTYRGILKEI